MKNDEFLGNDYELTFGSILNYQKLAHFIINLDICKCQSGFIDLACGTGNLIKSIIETTNNFKEIIGIDVENKQLKIALDKLNNNKHNVCFIKKDILDLKELDIDPYKNWIAHLGFAFLNRLCLDEINSFLINLGKNAFVNILICEIWNYDFQITHFKYGQWYRTELKEGFLLTRSKQNKASDDKAIDIEFIFKLPHKQLFSQYLMFRHKIEDIQQAMFNSNWKYFYTLKAIYRENYESHKVLILSKVPIDKTISQTI